MKLILNHDDAVVDGTLLLVAEWYRKYQGKAEQNYGWCWEMDEFWSDESEWIQSLMPDCVEEQGSYETIGIFTHQRNDNYDYKKRLSKI